MRCEYSISKKKSYELYALVEYAHNISLRMNKKQKTTMMAFKDGCRDYTDCTCNED